MLKHLAAVAEVALLTTSSAGMSQTVLACRCAVAHRYVSKLLSKFRGVKRLLAARLVPHVDVWLAAGSN